MAVFGGMSLTNKGLILQGKAQAGAQLNYTRIAVGDGSLSGQSISALNGLISQKKSLPISRLRTQPPNKAVIGTTLSNADISSGFFFREIGVFAQDPDAGEILYAYANSGVTADYIAPGGGSDVIEKAIDCVVIVGTAANITAMIDHSLVFALKTDLDAVAAAKVDKVSGKGLSTNDYTSTEKTKLAGIATSAGTAGSATDSVIGNRTISDATAPTADTAAPTTLFSNLGNMIKQITGGATWRTAPGMTIAAIKAILDAAVSAATANAIIKRDASGRAQVASPVAAADIARKDTVDAVQLNLNDHTANTTAHITAAERTAWNAKETTGGAQSKADAAKTAAITAAATDATTKANEVQANLTAHIGSGDAAHADVTTTTNGFMTASDKVKLNGVATGANNYTHPTGDGNHHVPATGSVNNTKVLKAGPTAGSAAWGVVNGSEVVEDASHRFATDAEKSTWNAKASTAVSTTSAPGLMSASDKTKLDGVATGANNYSHPNHTGDVISTGDGVTAIAPGVIIDADVNSAAAISWGKISKTGASLADLPTRSAGDLNSGTLLPARLPAATGDVTSPAGSNVFAIASGVIVNADVSATANIDASKIGTGIVSNIEFNYLDGVTSAIQTQLDAKLHVTDYVRQPAYATTGGTLTAYSVTLAPAPSSITEGFGITIVPNVTNGANPTLNINGLGAVALKDQKGVAFAAGKLVAGKPYMFRKVGTDFLADSSGGAGNAIAGDIRAGKTAATDNGDIVGTLAVQTGGTVTPTASNIVKPAGIYDTAITIAGVSVPAANVLTGTTIAGVAGTMPNITTGGDIAQGVGQWPDGGLAVYPSQGYRKGGAGAGEIKVTTAQMQSVEGDLTPINIRNGANVFGVVGTMVEGKRYATGTISLLAGDTGTISGLGFMPTMIVVNRTSLAPDNVHNSSYMNMEGIIFSPDSGTASTAIKNVTGGSFDIRNSISGTGSTTTFRWYAVD